MFSRTVPSIISFEKKPFPECRHFFITHWPKLYHMTIPAPITAKGFRATVDGFN